MFSCVMYLCKYIVIIYFKKAKQEDTRDLKNSKLKIKTKRNKNIKILPIGVLFFFCKVNQKLSA